MALFASKTAIAVLSDRMRELSDEIRSLKSAHKHLELEWEELYDKVRHQMARMSRRVKRDPKDGLDAEEVEVPAGDYPGVDPISAGILRRRNPGGPRT